ncbi:RNA-guided endonuclease InsQ/TnpB family protein [Micromonospora haikouensis]|uniref:RNA-guided endonuclease InsQ/TnpB family protein n=1 Tax=Micromonospora haikouensis TaxID=686309 RepID=UPI0036B6DA2E
MPVSAGPGSPKSVHDAGWAGFTTLLEYKAARYGRTFARVDRFFPSTRTCSQCGRITEKMTLNVRSWDCPCGATHDRDVNAAINVLAAGQADNSNDRGAREDQDSSRHRAAKR